MATSCQTMRLLHFVRNDTSCQIASSLCSSQRHLGDFFRDLLLVIAVGVAPIHPAPTQGLDSSERDRFCLSRHK